LCKISEPIRILKKIAVIILIIAAILPIGAYLALQLPSLQTYAAKRAAIAISNKIEGQVNIGKVYYIFFNRFIAKEVSITTGNDTLLEAGKISVKIDASELLSGKVRVNYLRMENGGFTLTNLTDSTTNLDLLIGRGNSNESDSSANLFPDIRATRLTLSNFYFSMNNPFSPGFGKNDGSVNFSNLLVYSIDLDANNIVMDGSSITANIKNLSFKEKNGFTLEKLQAGLTFTPDSIKLAGLFLEDGNSSLKAPKLDLILTGPKAFSDFTSKVKLDIDFDQSKISFRSIAAFASSLSDNNLVINVHGNINGPVSNLKTRGLKVTSESGLTYLELDARINGLPNTQQTTAFIDIINSTTTTNDLAYILSSLNGNEPVQALKDISPLVKYNFTGRIAGLLDDFVANGNLTSNIGEVYIDALIKSNQEIKGAMDIHGFVQTKELDLGLLTNSKSIGKLTLSSGMSAFLRDQTKGGPQFILDSLNIKKIEFNGYPYKNIYAVGNYGNNTFDGKVICRDPNLDLIFQGLIGTSPNNTTNSYYDFYADVIYANLAALNFDKRDSLSAVSLTTMANFTQKPQGDIEGTINIRKLNFVNSNGTFPIGDISVQSTSLQDNFSLFLRSSFANASYRGTNFLTNFVDKLLDITLHSNLHAIFPVTKPHKVQKPSSYSFNIEFNDTKSISQLILPGLFIEQGSTLSAEIDNNDNLEVQIKSKDLTYNKTYAKNLLLTINGNKQSMDASISSDILHFGGLSLDSSKVSINANDNLVKIKSEYTNKGDLENRLDFVTDILFTSTGTKDPLITDITIYPSELFLNGQHWNFSGSKIVNQDSTFVFHDFFLRSGEQYLGIDGIVSQNPYDTVFVSLNQLEISPFNTLLGTDNLSIDGKLSGNAFAVNLYKQPQIVANFKGKEMIVHEHLFGDLDIESWWMDQNKEFGIKISNKLDGRNPFVAQGIFRPKDQFIKIDASLDNLSVSYFEPFLEGIVSKTGGGVSGNLRLEGALDKLELTSNNTMLNNLSFLVDFTKVNYVLNGPVILTKDRINLNNVAIKDLHGNTGRVSGGLTHNYFKDLYLNTTIQFSNLEALNTTEADNSSFYGTAYGTGRLAITGPLDRIFMDISVATNRNTSIHIPLSSATEVSDNNLLTFVQPQSAKYDSNGNLIEKEVKQGTELSVKLRANMTPDAAMLIEIDKSVGDVITGYGSGLVTLDINPSKDIFSIQGDYRIQSGSYKFVLQGFIERDFTIQEGGNIGFNGDVMKTNLNLTANYRTKAAINTLIADTSSVSTRRTVDCQINMTGQLMNPRLGFNIDIPDIDPITKARVNAALNSEDKVVKQVMSLLVSGSFIPDVQSSIVNNSTLLYSNATEVLSNQINKIFNQLDIPLDLSFNYQPGQNGRDLFDAAVSAQLFNNRVIVNGNIGSAKYMDRTGDVVGDLDVEIKLDDKGRFRAKAFSHSADQYSNYLDNSQRNGVGLVYQEEFSTFRELINSLFFKRKKRKRTQSDKAMIKPREDQFIQFKELP